MSSANTKRSAPIGWPHAALAAAVLGSLAVVFSLPPLAQELAYHQFADRRAFFGIPNFWNVASNLPFLFVGIAGVAFRREAGWRAFFIGVALVAIGSGYYHWSPTNATLVWDRLPMTVAFMGLFAALLGEYVHPRLGELLLYPVLLLGLASVGYWRWADDLRLYLWVQLVPLFAVPLVMILFHARYSHAWMLPAAAVWYALAKAAELYDREVFALTGNAFSGHALKHLLAAAGCFTLLWMLWTRRPVTGISP